MGFRKLFCCNLIWLKLSYFCVLGIDIWPLFAIYRWFRSAQSVMDISGLATIPQTPTHPPTTAPPSQHVLRRPPLEGDFVTVTDSSGNRVYLRQNEDAGTKVKHPSVFQNQSSFFYICIFTTWPLYLTSVSMSLLFHSCLFPGGKFQNSARLPWCTGAFGSTNWCTKGSRDTEGEWQDAAQHTVIMFVYSSVNCWISLKTKRLLQYFCPGPSGQCVHWW